MTEKQDIAAWLEDLFERYRRPGLALSIVHRPEPEGEWIERHLCHGQANVKGSQWDKDTIFAIASTSKHLTPAAIDLLIRDGCVLPNGKPLSWTTRVKDVYPNWNIQDDFVRECCTLTDLAAMRSGLPGHDMAIADLDPDELLDLLQHLPPSTGLRQTFQYMNVHYALLANIIPTLTGQSFQEFSMKRIFEPLGMTDTYNAFSLEERTKAEATGRLADGYKQVLDVNTAAEAWKNVKEGEEMPDEMFGEPIGFRFFDRGFKRYGPGPGHVMTTPSSMAKWMKELIEPKVIPKETIETISKPQTAMAASGNPLQPEEGIMTYGLGLVIHQYRGKNAWSHGGGVPGYITHMIVLPQERLGVMILCNDQTYAMPLVKTIANTAIDRTLGLSDIDWEKRAMDEWMGYLGHVDLETLPPASPRAGVKGGIEGKYANKGYGSFSIRPLADIPEVEALLPSLQESSPTPIDANRPIWVTVYDKLFVSHIIFQHIDGPKYYFYSFGVYDNADSTLDASKGQEQGAGGKVAWSWTGGLAVFTDKGVGMYGQFSRRGNVDEKKVFTEENPEVNSEVWFVKQ